MMKKILPVYCLLLVFTLSLNAQVKVSKRSIKEATSAQTQLYQLNNQQAEKMAFIQEQRLSNLAAIEPLRRSNYELYLQKLRSIRTYTEQATRRILYDRQVPVFEAQQRQRMQARRQLLRDLKSRPTGREERTLALLRLEETWQDNDF